MTCLRLARPAILRRTAPRAVAAAVVLLLLVGASLPGRTRLPPPQAAPIPVTCDDVASATSRGGAHPDEGSRDGAGCTTAPARRGALVLVVRAIDGDTIELATGERVRYTGVDAPELRPDPEPLAEEAAKANKRLVEGRYVRLIQGVQDRDSFGRLLRYVLADGILVEAELAREGLAEAREYQLGQPYAACLQGLQREAQAAGRGLWGL